MAKRRLVLQDTLALLTILAFTAVLAVLTWLLFRSFSQHQWDAAARWKRRGELALQAGHPKVAVYDLRAALAYAPGDRATQIELAGALEQAGMLQEATAYFNTLWDREPGSGMINQELARLAVRQQQMASALEHYHAAIYGNWEGDGTVRRRQVRLELVRYLIQQNRFGEARDELLIAAGNDPRTPSLLEVSALLEQAHAPADALREYREIATRHPVSVAALEGAGQNAYTLGRYRSARTYLERALAAGNAAHPLSGRALAETNFRNASAVLAIYPSPQLGQRERLDRVVRAHRTAHRRFLDCAQKLATPPAASDATPAPPDPLAALRARWDAAHQHLSAAEMVDNPQLEQAAMQLVYDTEQITSHLCGEPTGEDAALLRIASSPDTVDQ